MKNKIAVTALALSLLVLLSGCGKSNEQEVVNPDPSQPAQASESAPASEAPKDASKYFFEQKGVKIVMNDPAKPILDALGEPMNKFEAPSCAFKGTDRIYSYSGFELYTYTDGDDETEYVFSVVFMDDSVATREGVGLSDKLDKIESKYGKDYAKENEQYTYSDGNTNLSFLLENGEVASVEYSLIVK